MKAVVGHHRHGHPVAGQAPAGAQVQGREREQLVAVHDRAFPIHRHHAVAVAVEGEAEVVGALRTAADSCSTWVEPQASLMLRPSGSSASTVTFRPQPPEDLRRHLVGGPVGAVEQHVEPAQVESRKRPWSSRR